LTRVKLALRSLGRLGSTLKYGELPEEVETALELDLAMAHGAIV
jgi:hypothetical protein